MTDWCLSKISFMGPEEIISELVEKFKGQPNPEGRILYQLFGGYFLPKPDFVRHGDYDVSRQWAWDHWGCKYASSGATLAHREEGVASFMLGTDWNPPVKALCWLTALPEYQQVNVRVDYELQSDCCDGLELIDPDGYCVFSQGRMSMEADSFYDTADVLT